MSVLRHTQEEAGVEAAIEEFGGDARAALRAVLHDLAVLAADYESCVSKGFVRGRLAVKNQYKCRRLKRLIAPAQS